ncbi:acetyl-CoA synthetase-like protein [Calocera viscosa TUFC12733]|uniref:Acetyl-CoA synthetase-like protein n=1 Tax=Calocera viscosa (strain TUFC12733) TaxID=1330018 RepID=A0A167JZJ2_CALVF|nr:acetyl-CoA synthetase-like protein [Calocera viscosa TUFC12733]
MASTNEVIHSINHLLDLRTEQHPDLEILAVPSKDLSYTKYTYHDLQSAAALLANYYNDHGILSPRATGDTKTRLTVALLSHSGWSYAIQELALIKMGYCVLFISVNNSAAAISHLLEATGSTHIITHQTFIPVVEEALSKYPPKQPVKLLPQVGDELYNADARLQGGKTGKTTWRLPLTPEEEENLPAFIVHSSGSTGFPKPIVLSHIASVRNFSQHFGLRGFTTLPLYHNHGHACFYRAIHGAVRIYLFPQSLIPLTTANIHTLLTSPDCNAEALFGVPYVLKILSEDPEGLEVLKSFKLVMFGGSACPDELGTRLVDAGVNLVGHYGLTEMGQIFTSFRDFKTDKGWNWLRGTGPWAKRGLMDWIKFEDRGEDVFELIVLDGYPTKVLSNRSDGSYSTKDLFSKHPSIPDAFKFVGRIDDTLVMVNGEKTNPVPIELTLRQSPNISDAVVFGAGRAQTGALIILAEKLSSSAPRNELYKLVQPAVDLANSKAPSHSQLAPEALIYLPYETVLPKADKGSFLRPKVYVQFKNIIDKVYRALEGEEDEGIERILLSDLEHAKRLVSEAVFKTLNMAEAGPKLEDDMDLFALGLDSLQATRIRNSLQRDIDLRGHRLPSNFVFEHPSVNAMAGYLLALSFGQKVAASKADPTNIMLQLVDKYSSLLLTPSSYTNGTFPDSAQVQMSSSDVHVVVLTGATGSLGAALLEALLLQDDVSKVYCLSRGKDDGDAANRVLDSVKTRGLSLKDGGTRLICLAVSDFSAPNLGLPPQTYREIARTVTVVIHNAWPVNFNWTISSFEPHISGAVNLMRLALHVPSQRPPKFFFSSSISAVFAWKGPSPVPESVTDDPHVAQNMGYARSKWVVEKLCQVASQNTPLQADVLRIGQMVGDSRTGVWNETEAISLIIKSAETIHALPELDETVSWLPVDYAARSILDLVFIYQDPSGPGRCHCWHVVQPHTVDWKQILDSLQTCGLQFKRVPQRQWVDFLRRSDANPVKNPTIKLLSFYEEKYDRDASAIAPRYPLETKFTEAASPSLKSAPAPNDELVAKWVAAWRKTGFLH